MARTDATRWSQDLRLWIVPRQRQRDILAERHKLYNTNPVWPCDLSVGGQGLQGLPDPVPATQLPHPLGVRPPRLQDRLQRVLLGLQVRIDRPSMARRNSRKKRSTGFSSGA